MGFILSFFGFISLLYEFNQYSPLFEKYAWLLKHKYTHSFQGQFLQQIFEGIEDISFEIQESKWYGNFPPMFWLS